MSRSFLSLACLLVLAAGGSASAQTPLTWTTSRTAQPLLGPGAQRVTDNSSRDGGESIVQVNTVQLDRFDKATGVLLGVRGEVVVDSATTLFVERPNSGGNYIGVGTVRAEWALQPTVTAFSGLNGLARLEVDQDTLTQATDLWNPLVYAGIGAPLDDFVGAALGAQLATSITTRLVASKGKAGGGENRVDTFTSGALTGAFSLSYSYLHHASAAFDANGATSLALQVPAGGMDITLFALGDAAHTTRLDLLDVACTGGACDGDILGWRFEDLAAGGSAVLHIGPGARSATYALLLGDDREVGAAGSLAQRTLTLQISAVPEPATWALWLAGAAGLGWRGLRRRAAA